MTVVLEETKQHDETVVLKRRPCFRLPFHPAKYDQEAIEMLTLLKEESSEATVEEARLLDSLHDLNQASKLLSQQEQRKEKLKQFIEENSFYDVDLRRQLDSEADFIRNTRLEKVSRHLI